MVKTKQIVVVFLIHLLMNHQNSFVRASFTKLRGSYGSVEGVENSSFSMYKIKDAIVDVIKDKEEQNKMSRVLETNNERKTPHKPLQFVRALSVSSVEQADPANDDEQLQYRRADENSYNRKSKNYSDSYRSKARAHAHFSTRASSANLFSNEKNKSKSENGYVVKKKLDQCSVQCSINTNNEIDVSKSSSSRSSIINEPYSNDRLDPNTTRSNKSAERPQCCKGGVSSIKFRYHSASNVTFYSPDLLSSFSNVIDKCNGDGYEASSSSRSRIKNQQDDDTSIMFISCDKCFPNQELRDQNTRDTTSQCDPKVDFSKSIRVSSEQDVCIASVSRLTNQIHLLKKFPIDLPLLFHYEDDESETIAVKFLHTSCSKPIYYPYGVNLDDCSADKDIFLINSTHQGNEVGDEKLSAVYFLDGTSISSSNQLFSTCSSTEESHHDHDYDPRRNRAEAMQKCCQGGASFLKIKVSGITSPGRLTFDSTSFTPMSSSNESSNKTGSSYVLPCSGGKIDGTSHSSSRDVISRGTADSVSFRSRKSHREYGYKSTRESVRFISCDDLCLIRSSSSGTKCASSASSVSINDGDTVCFGSWDNEEKLIDFDRKLPISLPVYFIAENEDDSVLSTHIHTSCSRPLYPPYVQELACFSSPFVLDDDASSAGANSMVLLSFIDGVSIGWYDEIMKYGKNVPFDYSFSGCRCTCSPPSLSPSTPIPTISPTPSNEVCLRECFAWVAENCKFLPTEEITSEKCVYAGTRKMLDVDSLAFDDIEREFLSLEKKIDHHKKMVDLYDKILSMIE